MKSLKDTYKLRNGYDIPCIGYGTYLIEDGEDCYRAVRTALDIGYRHIDTASLYGNEESVGRAVRESGIDRSEIFVTSKIWNNDQGFESTLRAFERTMERLGLDYLDLYLIHWPISKERREDWVRLNRETWQAMERLYEDSKIKAIGVSNFKPHHIASLMETSLTIPMVNQIELHPGLNQEDTVEVCRANDIIVEAWSPFSRGALFQTDALDDIAKRHGKTVAQVCLRWHLQNRILPLPKSSEPARIAENADIFNFELSLKDMEYISSLQGIKGSGLDPDAGV